MRWGGEAVSSERTPPPLCTNPPTPLVEPRGFLKDIVRHLLCLGTPFPHAPHLSVFARTHARAHDTESLSASVSQTTNTRSHRPRPLHPFSNAEKVTALFLVPPWLPRWRHVARENARGRSQLFGFLLDFFLFFWC